MQGTQRPESVCTKLGQIAELARREHDRPLQNLAHHIDIEWLKEAYRRTRKSGANGVDGQSAQEYAAHLESNLQTLHERMKSGTYRAPPVRRVHIPKGSKAGSETRPLGIPTFEDKIAQRSVSMVLEAIYEQEFYDCSYGFRPGKSAHQALDAMRNQLMKINGGWVLEIDFRKYFDSIDHKALVEVLRQRVMDGSILRLISKWLHAGVMEDGAISYPTSGSPQGGVISPILANIFLHEVLDKWFEHDVKPRMTSEARLFRYADDAVMTFANERDARRVLEALHKRSSKYGLTLHPEKTRLLDFRRPTHNPPGGGNGSRPDTFDILGFTHFWAVSKAGKLVVMRKTMRARFRRAIERVTEWCKKHRHDPIREQWRTLTKKLNGHYQYYGMVFNYRAINEFRYRVTMIWFRALRRRSQRSMTWEDMTALRQTFYLPLARITHRLTIPSANP